MATLLQRLFQEDAIVDDRVPITTFTIPFVSGEYGLFAPSPVGWKQLVVLLLLESVIQSIFGALIYKLIVQKRGTSQSYLIGWGFVIPASLYLPFFLLDFLNIRNKVVTLSSSSLMAVVCFRCVEAMYGTSPDVVETSIWTYTGYYSSVIPFVWDPKTKQRQRMPLQQIVMSTVEILCYFVALSVVLSFLIQYEYQPFDDPVPLTELTLTTDMVSPGHLLNSYCHAVLVYLTLKTGFDLTAFGENVKGFATEKIFDAPFVKSRTPTEFWTKRWNLIIHPLLKGGVFKPAKKYFNAQVAMFLTFVVSGLYHEYVWFCIFYNQKYLYEDDGGCTKEECYLNEFGRVTAFFSYVGVIMLLERPVSNLPPVKWLAQHLPSPVVAHLLVLLHLPVGQWYIGDWIKGGYFNDFSICTWLIRKL